MSDSEELDSFCDDNFDDYDTFGTTKRLSSLIAKPNTSDAESEGKFEFIDFNEIYGILKRNQKVVQKRLGLSEDEADILLKTYQFDPDKAEKEYRQDKEPGGSREDSEDICKICLEDITPGAKSLKCGHKFCQECWKDYITNALMIRGFRAGKLFCPKHGCETITPDSFVESFVSEAMVQKYRLFVCDNVLNESKNLRPCFNLKCRKIVVDNRVEGSQDSFGVCVCGFEFCFDCGSEVHKPATCENMKTWEDIGEKEFKTSTYILNRTKKCPSCSTNIEKDKGCNHIICHVCQHEFCWLCMEKWNLHTSRTGGFYKCNRFRAIKENKKKYSNKEKYIFYMERFKNHEFSIRLAKNWQSVIEKKILHTRNANKDSHFCDYDHLINAIKQITISKRVLKYTYLLAFYLKDEVKLFVLEDFQQILEKNIDLLHEYIERPIDEVDRLTIIDLTETTRKLTRNLLKGIK